MVSCAEEAGAGMHERETWHMGKEHIITLLVVHDDPWLRQGLRAWLERAADITVVGEASTGAEAITLAQTLHPDVSLLDIAQPTIDGAGSMASRLPRAGKPREYVRPAAPAIGGWQHLSASVTPGPLPCHHSARSAHPTPEESGRLVQGGRHTFSA